MTKLKRTRDDKIVGGVCGGISKYLDIDPSIVRLIFGLLILFYGISSVIYLLLWVIIPEEK